MGVVAVLPYPAFMLVGLGYQLHKEVVRRRNLRRVHVLHQGIVTLVHEAHPEEENQEDHHQEGLCELRRRIAVKASTAKRDADASMSLYLENSAKAKGGTGQELVLAEIK